MSKLLFPVPRLTYWAALALVATTLIAPLARADTVYTYTGNPFDNFGPSNSGTIATSPPICSISGFMVLASPIDFTDFRLVQVLSFNFTDQNTVLTEQRSGHFRECRWRWFWQYFPMGFGSWGRDRASPIGDYKFHGSIY
jgi:hypothetical protein